MDSIWSPLVRNPRTADDELQYGQKIGQILQSFSTCWILQVTFQDYIPKWQIFVKEDDDSPKMITKWRYPSIVWDGHPVLGFMAESEFKDAKGNAPAESSDQLRAQGAPSLRAHSSTRMCIGSHRADLQQESKEGLLRECTETSLATEKS